MFRRDDRELPMTLARPTNCALTGWSARIPRPSPEPRGSRIFVAPCSVGDGPERSVTVAMARRCGGRQGLAARPGSWACYYFRSSGL